MIDYSSPAHEYIRVSRFDVGPGSVNAGYPAPISNWTGAPFEPTASTRLYSGSKCYFFKGNQYIHVTRGELVPELVDAAYSAPICNWRLGAFEPTASTWPCGADGLLYFFEKATRYIVLPRRHRPGTVNPGYPAPVSELELGFLRSQRHRRRALQRAPGVFLLRQAVHPRQSNPIISRTIDPGYPAPISNWNCGAFGANGIDAALYGGGPLVAPPASTGLVSDHNYFLKTEAPTHPRLGDAQRGYAVQRLTAQPPVERLLGRERRNL